MAVAVPHIGQFRTVCKFERNEPTALGAGKKDNYVEWLTTRGALEESRGSRSLSFGEANIENKWTLFVRYQDALAEHIGKSIKIIANNMIFTVDSYTLVGQKQRYYYFTLNQKY